MGQFPGPGPRPPFTTVSGTETLLTQNKLCILEPRLPSLFCQNHNKCGSLVRKDLGNKQCVSEVGRMCF